MSLVSWAIFYPRKNRNGQWLASKAVSHTVTYKFGFSACENVRIRFEFLRSLPSNRQVKSIIDGCSSLITSTLALYSLSHSILVRFVTEGTAVAGKELSQHGGAKYQLEMALTVIVGVRSKINYY